MATDRKQINIRVDEQERAELPALCEAVGKATGLKITVTDLFRLGVRELRKKYMPEADPPAPKPTQ